MLARLNTAIARLRQSFALAGTSDALGIIKRLFVEQGVLYWKRYAIAFVLMGVTAACAAMSTYLLGTVINRAYIDRSLAQVLAAVATIAVLLVVRAGATYY